MMRVKPKTFMDNNQNLLNGSYINKVDHMNEWIQ
jgi:hypothetical protein